MRALDTNVLARWVLGDDPAQARKARAALAEPVWISLTVMLELGWVLSKPIGLARGIVADMLEQVVALETATIEHREALVWAISRYRKGADWADMIHVVSGISGADSFSTFDRALARKAGDDAPMPIETL